MQSWYSEQVELGVRPNRRTNHAFFHADINGNVGMHAIGPNGGSLPALAMTIEQAERLHAELGKAIENARPRRAQARLESALRKTQWRQV